MSTTADVVAAVAQLYDPLGLALKEQLYGRLIIRETFDTAKRDESTPKAWKRIVSLDMVEETNKWITMANEIDMACPRLCNTSEVNIFVDASQTCWVYEVRDENMKLILSKGGLTPARATIPRNELLALYEGVKAAVDIVRVLNPRRVYIFSDSQCNVQRVMTHHNIPLWESRRIEHIRKILAEITIPVDIIHIPGDINPADYATRPRSTERRPVVEVELLKGYQADPSIPRVTQAKLAGRNPDGTNESVVKEVPEEVPEPDYLNLMKLRTRRKDKPEPPPTDHAQPSTPTQEDENDTDPSDDTRQRAREKIIDSQGRFLSIDDRVMPDVSVDKFGIFLKGNAVFIPSSDRELIKEIMQRIHTNHGHPGKSATLRMTKPYYYWKGMSKDTGRFVEDCEVCTRSRAHRATRAVAGDALRFTDFEKVTVGGIVGIDIATIEAAEDGKASCILTATCALTKWVRVTALETQLAAEVVGALERIFNRTIYPIILVMDNAKSFRSQLMRKFSVRHGVRLCYSPAHASAYNGWIERSHKAILTALRVLQLERVHEHWSDLVAEAEHLVNSRPYSGDCELSPLHMVYGASSIPDPEKEHPDIEELVKVAGMSHMLTPSSDELQLYKDRALNRHKKLLKRYETVFKQLRKATREKLLRKHRDQSNTYPVGSWVHVYRPTTCKTRSQWSEPRRVVGIESPAVRLVERNDSVRSMEWIANLRPAGSVPNRNL
jgi:transposase InsO family protein